MVYRFKFRVWGGKAPGKYVLILEDGAEMFMNASFEPSLERKEDSGFYLSIKGGRTQVAFLRGDLQWNGKTAPSHPVELHPGHLIGCRDEIVEILECPELAAASGPERTRFLDLNNPENATRSCAIGDQDDLKEKAVVRAPKPVSPAPVMPPRPPVQETARNPALDLDLTPEPEAAPDSVSGAVEIVNMAPALPVEPNFEVDLGHASAPEDAPVLEGKTDPSTLRTVPPLPRALPPIPQPYSAPSRGQAATRAKLPPAPDFAPEAADEISVELHETSPVEKVKSISGIQPIPDGNSKIIATAVQSVEFTKAIANPAEGGHVAANSGKGGAHSYNWQAASVIAGCLLGLAALRIHGVVQSNGALNEATVPRQAVARSQPRATVPQPAQTLPVVQAGSVAPVAARAPTGPVAPSTPLTTTTPPPAPSVPVARIASVPAQSLTQNPPQNPAQNPVQISAQRPAQAAAQPTVPSSAQVAPLAQTARSPASTLSPATAVAPAPSPVVKPALPQPLAAAPANPATAVRPPVTSQPAASPANPVVVQPVPIQGRVEPKKVSAAALGAFLKALEEGNLEIVQSSVEREGLSQDFSLDELGRTPFVRAAAFGRLTIMKYLLSKKADLNALDFAGNNALMWAAINGHGKTVEYLLQAGLDPKWRRDDGADALKLAHEYRQKQIEQLLRKVAGGKSAKGDRKPASKKKHKKKTENSVD
jgi:Ankyrin repeats (3 copies)